MDLTQQEEVSANFELESQNGFDKMRTQLKKVYGRLDKVGAGTSSKSPQRKVLSSMENPKILVSHYNQKDLNKERFTDKNRNVNVKNAKDSSPTSTSLKTLKRKSKIPAYGHPVNVTKGNGQMEDSKCKKKSEKAINENSIDCSSVHLTDRIQHSENLMPVQTDLCSAGNEVHTTTESSANEVIGGKKEEDEIYLRSKGTENSCENNVNKACCINKLQDFPPCSNQSLAAKTSKFYSDNINFHCKVISTNDTTQGELSMCKTPLNNENIELPSESKQISYCSTTYKETKYKCHTTTAPDIKDYFNFRENSFFDLRNIITTPPLIQPSDKEFRKSFGSLNRSIDRCENIHYKTSSPIKDNLNHGKMDQKQLSSSLNDDDSKLKKDIQGYLTFSNQSHFDVRNILTAPLTPRAVKMDFSKPRKNKAARSPKRCDLCKAMQSLDFFDKSLGTSDIEPQNNDSSATVDIGVENEQFLDMNNCLSKVEDVEKHQMVLYDPEINILTRTTTILPPNKDIVDEIIFAGFNIAVQVFIHSLYSIAGFLIIALVIFYFFEEFFSNIDSFIVFEEQNYIKEPNTLFPI